MKGGRFLVSHQQPNYYIFIMHQQCSALKVQLVLLVCVCFDDELLTCYLDSMSSMSVPSSRVRASSETICSSGGPEGKKVNLLKSQNIIKSINQDFFKPKE